MKLTKFRVQNYKKINDTGWVDVGRMTAFVGKNEAGKSAVFRGLSKLNPSDGTKYDGLKEFPRRRYTDEFKLRNWPVSSAVFELDENEAASLARISSAFEKTTSVTVTRYYNNKVRLKYEPDVQRCRLSKEEFGSMLDCWEAKVSKMTSSAHEKEMPGFKDALLGAINSARAAVQGGDQVTRDHLLALQSQLVGAISAPWQKKPVADVTGNVDQLVSQFQINQGLEKAFQFIWAHLPRFIYFDHYDVLDSAVNIDEFIAKLANHPSDPKVRITKCLFEHAGLDIGEIRKLDPTDAKAAAAESQRMADKRRILMSSAANSMTKEFAAWWEQRKHKFHYEIDGLQFRVWVSDDLDASEIELDQRSAGMQYFFSFLLVFLTESAGRHANSILLLDEPGLQFHGTAQQKTVEFLRKLSADNQLLYTTHSPFMVDADRLEDVRVVTEGKNNFGSTKVSNDVWPRDPDALFPLQAGLGYNMAQSLFYSKWQVIVEGITDYKYLKTVSGILASRGRCHLDDRIVISPAGGAKNVMRLASLLLANDIRTATVLDGDEAGRLASKKLKDFKELSPDVVIIDEFTGKEKSEIEDMFGDPLFMEALKKAYPSVAQDFNADEEKIVGVAQKASELFKRKGENFDKHALCTAILDMLDKNSTSAPSGEALEKFEKLFERLNNLCGPPTERGSGSLADP